MINAHKEKSFAIVMVTDSIVGGAERRFLNLFRYISIKKTKKIFLIVSESLKNEILRMYPDICDVQILTFKERFIRTRKVINNNIPSTLQSYRTNLKVPAVHIRMRRFLKSALLNFDIFLQINNYRVHNNIDSLLGVYSGIIPLYYFLFFKSRPRIVYCMMDSWFTDIFPRERKYWYKMFSSFNFAIERSDFIDFLSPSLFKGLIQRGFVLPEKKYSITACSFVDYSKCDTEEKTDFIVTFSGRMEENKNPLLFVEVASKMILKYKDIKFVLMGKGQLSGIVSEKVHEFNSPNLQYLGFLTDPIPILKKSSVFVSIQTYENYPSQSVLEAMACGNVIIASNVGDTKMFINDKNGILIDLNADSLFEAIEILFLNRNKTSEMGDFAFDYVRSVHSIEMSAEYYLNLLATK